MTLSARSTSLRGRNWDVERGSEASTVVVQNVHTGGRIEYLAINACLAPILSGLLSPPISPPGVETDRVVCVSGG